MGARLCKAVLDLRLTDFDGINKQAKLFLDHLFKETTLYPDPWVSKSAFEEQWKLSAKATTDAIDSGKVQRSARNTECSKTHYLMAKKLIPYINGLYRGRRDLIEMSGAKVCSDSSPVPIPDQPIIKKVERGPVPNSVKIFLCRGINSKQKRCGRIRYRIFMFQHFDDNTGIEVGQTFSSIALIGNDIPYDIYNYFAVSASNPNGTSPFSEKVKFWLSEF